MTWPGALTFGDLDLKFSGKLWNSSPNIYSKNGGAAAIAKKTRGGGVKHPPVGRGLMVTIGNLDFSNRKVSLTWPIMYQIDR